MTGTIGPERRPRRRAWRTAAGAALALAGAVALAACGAGGSGSSAASTSTPAGTTAAGRYARPANFTLRDQSGRMVRLSAQRGRWVYVTFLYTHCPDVCPLIASHLNTVLEELPPAARARTRVLAVSVDPAHDTPAAVRGFIRTHGLLPQFRYLTGTRAQLAPVWRDYAVAVDPATGRVDHSAYELLIDPSGRGRLIYDTAATPPQFLHDLRALGAA